MACAKMLVRSNLRLSAKAPAGSHLHARLALNMPFMQLLHLRMPLPLPDPLPEASVEACCESCLKRGAVRAHLCGELDPRHPSESLPTREILVENVAGKGRWVDSLTGARGPRGKKSVEWMQTLRRYIGPLRSQAFNELLQEVQAGANRPLPIAYRLRMATKSTGVSLFF